MEPEQNSSDNGNASFPSAEYIAENMQRSGQVPDKFKNEDGTVNVEALAKSYTELEKVAFTKNTKETSDPAPVEEPAVIETPGQTLDEMLEKPKVTVWDRLETESASGNISPETVNELKAQGIPDSVINRHIEGLKVQAERRTEQAANAVGGVENLSKAMDFARNNFSPEQLEAFKSQLNGPMWETTLKGLALQAGLDLSTSDGRKSSVSASGPSATPSKKEAKPYASQAEMLQDQYDPRYKFDPEFQEHVYARLRATPGISTRQS